MSQLPGLDFSRTCMHALLALFVKINSDRCFFPFGPGGLAICAHGIEFEMRNAQLDPPPLTHLAPYFSLISDV